MSIKRIDIRKPAQIGIANIYFYGTRKQLLDNTIPKNAVKVKLRIGVFFDGTGNNDDDKWFCAQQYFPLQDFLLLGIIRNKVIENYCYSEYKSSKWSAALSRMDAIIQLKIVHRNPLYCFQKIRKTHQQMLITSTVKPVFVLWKS